MINLQSRDYCPLLNEIEAYVKNPLFSQFCSEIKEKYKISEKIEYSSCSWEKGWNVKFKKSGKTLCTIYPREQYFTVLVVVGQKEKARVESLLPDCCAELREIYRKTTEGNGQKWLMIDLEDDGAIFRDVLRLIEIRSARQV
ncbi:MAG: DUF3788 domain-containing protein [Lachnospiraceae bacterium]|nr:DUF3788 domain-containing protein [Lachnospiraceae bacterium]